MPSFWGPFAIGLGAVGCFTSLAHGQNAPTPVNGAAFARSRTKLYIHGGVVSSYGSTLAPQNQLVSLDLAVPWQANAPAWNILKPGPTLAQHSAIVSADEKTFVTFRTSSSSTSGSSSYLSNRYHIATNSWEQSAVKVQNPTKEGVQAVEDEVSGLVYLAGGFQNDESQMYVYNVDYDSISMFPMPSNYMEDRKDYAAVYLKSRKSILYFGGSTSTGQISADLVTEFIPSTGSWTTLNIYNQNPPHRTDFCMVANDDGSKVVVFGGRLDNGGYAKDLWVLDVATLTWTQGPSWVEPRISTTCTVAGSMFIAWGGSNGLRTVDGTAILYDLDQGQYVSAYVPPPSYASSNGGQGVQSGNPADNPAAGNPDLAQSNDAADERAKSNAMLIVGGIIGAVFLLACLILVSVFVRKHRKKIQSQCIGFSGHYNSYEANPPRPSTSNSFATLSVSATPQARDAFAMDEEKQISPVHPHNPSTAA
ncbi:hypothetical protein EC968_003170 [Mortierella alpina]|nr:hypothetical protein EC968_003170 [Mortierella alpina]